MQDVSIVMVEVPTLRHIEGFSQKRVDMLKQKILDEGIWNKPIALDEEHNLVLDGQHRMEVARALNFTHVPAVRYRYADVEVWSLRTQYDFDWKMVVEKALSGDIYPYKTVKHRFPQDLPVCAIPLSELKK